jgi:hypothetical protein
MNIWLIATIIIGVLLLGGIAIIASAQITQAQNQQADVETTGEVKSCGYSSGSGCPYSGKCDANRDCGLAGCGAAKTGSCGCGR